MKLPFFTSNSRALHDRVHGLPIRYGRVTAIPTSSEFATVGETITTSVSIHPSTLVSVLADDFFRQPNLDAAAVVEGERPVGLITRQKFLFTVFRRFGWEVFGRKSVSELTERDALVVAADTRLDVALSLSPSTGAPRMSTTSSSSWTPLAATSASSPCAR